MFLQRVTFIFSFFLSKRSGMSNKSFQMSNIGLSRSEMKARKAVLRLGLEPLNGVERVSFTVGPHKKVYSISQPKIFKSNKSDTYIVFGELTFESEDSVKSSYVCCEQTSTFNMSTGEEDKSIVDAEESQEATTEEEIPDASDIEEEDIDIIIRQSHLSRAKAIEVLRNNENDIINAIMDLTL
jgi:nascent polypeptide-associated complex subunit alpha